MTIPVSADKCDWVISFLFYEQSEYLYREQQNYYAFRQYELASRQCVL